MFGLTNSFPPKEKKTAKLFNFCAEYYEELSNIICFHVLYNYHFGLSVTLMLLIYLFSAFMLLFCG